MALIYLYFMLAFLVALMAINRGRVGWRWFLIALFASPLIAGLLVLALPRELAQPLRPRSFVPMPATSMIRIIRPVDNRARPTPFEIFVNGTRVGRILRDGVVDIPVPSGPLAIEARTDWVGSYPLLVETAPRKRIDIELLAPGGALNAFKAFVFGNSGYLKLRQVSAA